MPKHISNKVRKIRRANKIAEMKKIKPEKPSEIKEMPARKFYPHFGIDLKHLPQAKQWEIGKTYKVALEIKQTSISMDESLVGGKEGRAGFDIIGIKVI